MIRPAETCGECGLELEGPGIACGACALADRGTAYGSGVDDGGRAYRDGPAGASVDRRAELERRRLERIRELTAGIGRGVRP